MTEKFGSGRFCSRACANTRVLSDEVKKKIGISVKKISEDISENCKKDYLKNPNKCIVCGNILPYEDRYRSTCSDICLKQRLKTIGNIGGLISANSQQRRSKNEIYFCELCENYFKEVKHNEPIFNG